MRLFVALEVPMALRSELARRARALAGEAPAARWVRPEAMHLTLSFLGEIQPREVPALDDKLTPAFAAAEPLALRLGEVGAFPPRGRARVLWAGLVAGDGLPSEGLAELQPAVARAVERTVDAAPDRRAFHPHVTLARCLQPWNRPAFERFREAFGAPPDDAFEVREGNLFESELHPSGARYRVVRSYPLGAAA